MVTFNLSEEQQQQQQQQIQAPVSQQLIPPNSNEISGIFSVLSNRPPYSSGRDVRWPTFSSSMGGGSGGRSFWTKYCLLCTVCGSAATILAGIFLVIAALFRYYTTSIYYFETVPTYIPAILLSICGVSTIAFSCKRNRNIILLRITACWSLCSAALSSVITITTSLIHMNRLQTLKECAYNKNPPSCTCFAHAFGIGPGAPDTVHYIFENTPDCDVIHGILYSCLRAVFAISVVAVLLSIFLCMLLYQLIGHERKKAYWSRIRRINSDWSADFIACLGRPMVRDRGGVLPLVLSPSVGGGMSLGGGSGSMLPPPGWGPPPPYEEVATESVSSSININNRPFLRPLFPMGHPISNPNRVLRLVTSQSENSFRNSDGLISPHPFSPTITSIDPVNVFRHQQDISQSYACRINNGSSGTIGGISDIMDNQLSLSTSRQLTSGNSSRFAINNPNQSINLQSQTSMSSITSLSIPETMKSTNTNTPCDLSITEEVNEEPRELTFDLLADDRSKGQEDEQVENKNLSSYSLLQKAVSEPKVVKKSQQKISSHVEDYYTEDTTSDDKLDLLGTNNLSFNLSKSSFSKITSLPCSPLLHMKKLRFWPPGVKEVKEVKGKSVQNLTSNFEYQNLGKNKPISKKRLSRGKPETCLFIRDEELEEAIKEFKANQGIKNRIENLQKFNTFNNSRELLKESKKVCSLPSSPKKNLISKGLATFKNEI